MFELNDETRWILGRPNFACAGIARSLRLLGQQIKNKAEDEQAAVIHWMLNLYEAHGDKWREAGERVLKDAQRVFDEQRRLRSQSDRSDVTSS